MVAAEPAPDWFLVDRYWAGAVLKDLGGLIIVNKLDLGTEAIQPELDHLSQSGIELRRSELALGRRHRRTQVACSPGA